MRARYVNFEKTHDPMKTMKIGSHRELSGQHLIDKIFDNIYDDLKDDPKYARQDPIIFKDDVYNWIITLIEDANLGETGSMHPEEITTQMYREFYDDIHEDDIEEEDTEDIDWQEHWDENPDN